MNCQTNKCVLRGCAFALGRPLSAGRRSARLRNGWGRGFLLLNSNCASACLDQSDSLFPTWISSACLDRIDLALWNSGHACQVELRESGSFSGFFEVLGEELRGPAAILADDASTRLF
jgi:hypothetical protein